jgi:hypothetical protein
MMNKQGSKNKEMERSSSSDGDLLVKAKTHPNLNGLFLLSSEDFVSGHKKTSLKTVLEAKALAEYLAKQRNEEFAADESFDKNSSTNHNEARYGGFLSEAKVLSENLIKFMNSIPCLFYRTIEYAFYRASNNNDEEDNFTTLYPLASKTSSPLCKINPETLIFTLFHATTNTDTDKSSGPIYWGCGFGGKAQTDDKIYTGITFTYHPRG